MFHYTCLICIEIQGFKFTKAQLLKEKYVSLPGNPDPLLDETQRDNADRGQLDHGAGGTDGRRAHAAQHTAQPHGAQGTPFS